jgi:hypothetical protein
MRKVLEKQMKKGLGRARGSCTGTVAWGSEDRLRRVYLRANICINQALLCCQSQTTYVPPGQLPTIPRQSVKVSHVVAAQN